MSIDASSYAGNPLDYFTFPRSVNNAFEEYSQDYPISKNGMSRPTFYRFVNDMLDQGYLTKKGRRSNNLQRCNPAIDAHSTFAAFNKLMGINGTIDSIVADFFTLFYASRSHQGAEAFAKVVDRRIIDSQLDAVVSFINRLKENPVAECNRIAMFYDHIDENQREFLATKAREFMEARKHKDSEM